MLLILIRKILVNGFRVSCYLLTHTRKTPTFTRDQEALVRQAGRRAEILASVDIAEAYLWPTAKGE